MKETKHWAYSFDNEYYNSPLYVRFDDALKNGILDAKESDYEKVYVGRVMEFVPSIDPDLVIEELQQKAYDEAGEVSLDYLEHIPLKDRLKLGEMLTETFKQWAKDTKNEPSFFTVEEVSEHIVEVNKKVGE